MGQNIVYFQSVPLPKLTKPLVFFDLETTGLLLELDRIIEISLLKIFTDGKTFCLPSVSIPA